MFKDKLRFFQVPWLKRCVSSIVAIGITVKDKAWLVA